MGTMKKSLTVRQTPPLTLLSCTVITRHVRKVLSTSESTCECSHLLSTELVVIGRSLVLDFPHSTEISYRRQFKIVTQVHLDTFPSYCTAIRIFSGSGTTYILLALYRKRSKFVRTWWMICV